MSQFYFAWVGDDPVSPFTLLTKGDVWAGSFTVLGSIWGGELSTTGDIPTTGVWIIKGPRLINLASVDGLVIGEQYTVTGTGIATSVDGVSSDTTFTFDGIDDGGSLNPHAELAEGLSVRIASSLNRDIVRINDPTGMVIGRTYSISGHGIPSNTVFTYSGGNAITISNPATATGSDVELKIGFDLDRNLITNLSNAAGLVVGETYQVFGRGIPSGTLGTYQDDGSVLLTQLATTTSQQTFLRFHRGTLYPDGGPFDEIAHARFDEQILSIAIEQTEGNFATLAIGLKNPRIGLLAPGRNVWCWLSWQKTNSDSIAPLFHGRLVGIPPDIIGEKVTLQFVARPADYENQQQLLIASQLREPPYYDAIWLNNGIEDAATILEARTALWHVDRVTLAVSISDIIVGEDDTLDVSASEHLYNEMNLRYGSSPLSGVHMTATVTWDQEGSGVIDITQKLHNAFGAAGSTYPYPNISSYCGDGLLSSWPKPNASIGGGWTVGENSIIKRADRFNAIAARGQFVSRFPSTNSIDRLDAGFYPIDAYPVPFANTFAPWAVTYPLNVFNVHFEIAYETKRSWTETVSFFMEADTQQILTDSRSSIESLSLNSSLISQPVDPDGSTPLADPRYNSYFKSERGQESFRFLLSYARAKLLARARAVIIEFTIKWEKGINLSCRQNVTIHDYRIPGGVATGKVTAYRLVASATDGMKALVTIGCTIGRGGSVAASPGTADYVDDGYMDSGQAVAGGTVDIGDGSVAYQNFDDLVVADDGVNLFDLRAETAIKRIKVVFGINEQNRAIGTVKTVVAVGSFPEPIPSPDPVAVLNTAYTRVILELKPVDGSGFLSEFVVGISKLYIPKTIDLEADSV